MTQKADLICDGKVAAFIRSSEKDDDLLIVMNLSGQNVRKNLLVSAKGFRLAEKLCTNDEKITYQKKTLTMPACSIAVFTRR